MQNAEQTKDAFLEAIFEVIDRILEKARNVSDNIIKEKENQNPNDKEISLKAKEIMKFFKEHPEIAKDIIKNFVDDNLKKEIKEFNNLNTVLQKELDNAKKNIESEKNSSSNIDIERKKELSIVNQAITQVEQKQEQMVDHVTRIEKKMNQNNQDLYSDEKYKIAGERITRNLPEIIEYIKEYYDLKEYKDSSYKIEGNNAIVQFEHKTDKMKNMSFEIDLKEANMRVKYKDQNLDREAKTIGNIALDKVSKNLLSAPEREGEKSKERIKDDFELER